MSQQRIKEAPPQSTDIPSMWGEPQVLTPENKTISASVAGNNLALIFEDLGIELNTADGPLTGATVISVNAPITLDENKPFLGYVVSIEGQVIKDQDTRATIVADVVGALKTMEFTYGEATGFDGEQGGGIILQQFFSLERRGTRAQYESGKRPAVPPVTITLTLTAQRITTQGRLLLKIDSMSIEAIELPG